MRFGRYRLNKFSSKIIIHKNIDVIFINKCFLTCSVNFLKLDFVKMI